MKERRFVVKKKHKVCFVFAIIFTALTLVWAVFCVCGQIEMAASEYNENGNDDGMEELGYLVGTMAVGLGLVFGWINVFFWGFGGVVTSAVNFNCPNEKIRLISWIMLGFDGVCMTGCVTLFLYSIIIA